MKTKGTDSFLTTLKNSNIGDVFTRDYYAMQWDTYGRGHYFIRTDQYKYRTQLSDGTTVFDYGVVDLQDGELRFFHGDTKILLYPMAKCMIDIQ